MKKRTIVLAILAMCAAWCGAPESAARESTRHFFGPGKIHVLILHSYNLGMRWSDNVTLGVMSVLEEGDTNMDVRVEFMDAKRISSEEYFHSLYELYQKKFPPDQFDVIITVDDDAFNFMRRYRAPLFGETPVVFCGVNFFSPEVLDEFSRCTGVVEAFDLVATLDLALNLHSGAKRVFVVNDDTVTGISNRKRVDEIAPRYAGRMDFVHLHDMTMEEMLVAVEQIPPDSLMLLMSFNRDKSGRMFRYRDAARLICPKSPVPVYVIWDFYLGEGVVGGMLISGFSQGEAAGRMAVRILSGESPDDIPVVRESPNRFMFDYTQLVKWGISRERLPPGSLLLNEPRTIYEVGAGTAWGILSVVALLGLLSVILALDIYERRKIQRALEEANRSLRREMVEREEAQQRLQEREEQLRQAQKMEALGRLAGGVAHDFNNLLMSVIGFARLAQEKLQPSDPAREDMEEVVRAGERAAGVTRQLLALGRRQMLEIQPVDINHVVSGMDRLLRHTLGEDIEMVTVLGEDLPPVKGDAGYLEQVVLNLAVNARDAMKKGGKLRIVTSLVTVAEGSQRHHAGTRPGNYVQLLVHDTGHGMTPDVRRQAMEPFFTTKERGEGSGLGLAVVYGIVKQFDGHVEIDSAPDKGTEVRILLQPAPALNEVAPKAPEMPLPRGNETLLVVEDEELVRMFIVRILSSAGYRVLEAANGLEAFEKFKSRVNTIDLLFTDMVMPQMGGRDLAERLREIRPDLKVLFTTGFAHEAVASSREKGPSDPILLKPSTQEAVVCKVREVLDRK